MLIQTKNGRNICGPMAQVEEGEEDYAWRREDRDGWQFVWPRRTEMEVEGMVHDAFACADHIHAEAGGNEGDPEDSMNDPA